MKFGVVLFLRKSTASILAGVSGSILCVASGNLSSAAFTAEGSAGFAIYQNSLAMRASTRAAQSPDSLVERSKRAIIETGISASYFDKHFKLVKTVDDPADQRVEWLFSVNGYEAQLVDAIGFHSTGGKRVYVHGIKNQLHSTHEIAKTLSLHQARRVLRRCIGKYESESVIYSTLSVPGKAKLYLTGRSVIERDRKQERNPKETGGEDEGRFLYVGFVDVETGKCVKKLGRGSS